MNFFVCNGFWLLFRGRMERAYDSLLANYKCIIISKVATCGAFAMAVYKFIEKKGFTGKYNTVVNYVWSHKKVEQQKATIRFETKLTNIVSNYSLKALIPMDPFIYFTIKALGIYPKS